MDLKVEVRDEIREVEISDRINVLDYMNSHRPYIAMLPGIYTLVRVANPGIGLSQHKRCDWWIDRNFKGMSMGAWKTCHAVKIGPKMRISPEDAMALFVKEAGK